MSPVPLCLETGVMSLASMGVPLMNTVNSGGKMFQLIKAIMWIGQIWQTYKGSDMDQEDRQHKSRRGELPIEPRMGQALTYWRPLPEVSPDEDFQREIETLITEYVILVV